MRESDENQIAEQARIAERSIEDQHLRMLESECARARRMLLEEQEQVRRLKLEAEEITRNSMIKTEEVRVAERRKQEKYMQMLENAKEARVAEGIKHEENIQLLKTECVQLRRELEQERKQRLQLEQDGEVQIAKRKAEKLSQELANARKNLECAEDGWMKTLRELEEERELVRMIKTECEEIRQSFMRQMENKEQELANALNTAAVAEAKLSDLEREINSLDDKACAICLTNDKDVAFGCGHMTCGDCMLSISNCHMCREPITSHLRLFPG
ncbi:nuclear-pore anchor-like [Neltuma alba]|uniref:nuclear-pore anchor-like n=1 Tax=Neltuma alba TaxID=207710 RepID=UPI0010A4312A|nr:nuclear-pore anchor-like [Prosopis alba]